MNRNFLLIFFIAFIFSFQSVCAMEVKVVGNTIIMSGTVVADDLGRVGNAFRLNPNITVAILRNSNGGHAPNGYRIGELFRQKNITTAVSGFCISSCSRMYLGGLKRIFTDDYPVNKTYVAFHGHYKDGHLDLASVNYLGLYRWILKFSDGKADESLVKRWTTLEKANGIAAFFSPHLSKELDTSAFICEGNEQKIPLGCEKLSTNGIDRGVFTHLEYISTPDQNELPEKLRASQFPKSGFAEIGDLDKFPQRFQAALDSYKRFLQADSPKAFAISPQNQFGAWNSGVENVNEIALRRCEERAKQSCLLYAVDENVVFKP